MRVPADTIWIVTGSSGMLGGEVVRRLLGARAGRVVGLDLRPPTDSHPSFHHQRCNVSLAAEVDRALDSFDGTATRVIHCAATNDAIEASELRRTSVRSIDACASDIAGCVNVITATGSAMVESGVPGGIICIGSHYAAVAPDPRLYASCEPAIADKSVYYVAAKAATEGVVRHLGVRYAADGIHINCLSPGGIGNSQRDDFVRGYEGRVPSGRMATAGEIAELSIELAGPKASYVVGQCLTADGGYSAW